MRYILPDNEAQYLINGLRRYLAAHGETAKVQDAAKRRIADRIAFVNHRMAEGKFRIMRECTRLRDGLCGAAWDPDAADDRRLDNFTSDIDILDAMEYSIERYMNRTNS
jgi:hypothetical protein